MEKLLTCAERDCKIKRAIVAFHFFSKYFVPLQISLSYIFEVELDGESPYINAEVKVLLKKETNSRLDASPRQS